MTKYIKTIPLSEIDRMAVVPGNGRSLAQCKGTADYVCNGGFYDDCNRPVGHLKIGGEVRRGRPGRPGGTPGTLGAISAWPRCPPTPRTTSAAWSC